MGVLSRALLLAGAFAHLTCAQTIDQDGLAVSANQSTVSVAAELVNDNLVLTDEVLANLSSLQLSNVSLFQFPENINTTSDDKRELFTSCKTFPGDTLWPSALIWNVFDLLTGGALIKTVPIGAVCYNASELYDEAECATILGAWTESATHASDPTSVMSPLFQGKTCMPQNGNDSICELGGFPSYVVNISTVAQVQLAVNLARNLNIRLVVKNTGHDFLGKSTGAGALSIWTHHLKSFEYVESYSDAASSYSGPAVKLGAGIEVGELYAYAQQYGFTAVGGECKGVGVTGGYTAGGGHSPHSSLYGMGADQVLSIDIVLPNGRFVTADAENNSDIFWAIRGGGGGTWGVVINMTYKVHPKLSYSGMTFAITTGNDSISNVTTEVFWSAIEIYWRNFPQYADQGNYGYSSVYPRFDGGTGYTWTFHPWLAPDMTLDAFKKLIAPLVAEWQTVGFDVEPAYFEYADFITLWQAHFPTETVANSDLRTGSRIFPTSNWDDETTLNETVQALRDVVEAGSALILYNIRGPAPEGVDNAVNPPWRNASMYTIVGSSWTDDSAADEIKEANLKITDTYLERLREVSPGGGSYLNEADVMEPNFGQAFYGSNYDKLLEIKAKIDPWDTFWAPTAVGSEGWNVTGQTYWLETQNARLCRTYEFYHKYFGLAPAVEVIEWIDKIVTGDRTKYIFRCDDPDGDCDIPSWEGIGEVKMLLTKPLSAHYLAKRASLWMVYVCGYGYTVTNSALSFYFASDLIHRFFHMPSVGGGGGVVEHYADDYNERLELAISAPGRGRQEHAYLAGEIVAKVSSSSAASATATSITTVSSAGTTTTTVGTEFHTHSTGGVHCA
ncbi:restculine oxidase [Seiridium cupressi]